MHLVVSCLNPADYLTSTCLLYHARLTHVVLEHTMFYHGTRRYYTSQNRIRYIYVGAINDKIMLNMIYCLMSF